MTAAKKLPARRQRGLILSFWYCNMENKWNADVSRFGCSASLMCAANEGELNGFVRGQDRFQELSDKDMEVIYEWEDHFEDYVKIMEKKTGLVDEVLAELAR